MFEEEAEEYLKKDGTKAEQILNALNEISPLKITLKQLPFILAVLEQAFKDGAEFGYNKAKEEMQKNGLALQSDMDKTIEQNIALKKELNKANEWHYVKDELPPEHIPLNIFTLDKDKKKRLWTGEYKGGNGEWWTGYFNHFIDKPYAWKEIVLPEEVKGND